MTVPFRKRLLVAALAAALLLSSLPMAPTTAWSAEEEWPLFPKGRGTATPEGKPAEELGTEAAAKAGEEAGKKTAAGVSAGTVAMWTAIGAGVVGLGILVFSGGGGNGTTAAPAH